MNRCSTSPPARGPPRSPPTRSGPRRHAEAIKHRQHPLAVALQTPIPLHPDAPPNPFARDTPGLRCGTCKHRAYRGNTSKRYQKCWLRGGDHDMYPRLTGGPGTDIRAWWPACTDYQPREATT